MLASPAKRLTSLEEPPVRAETNLSIYTIDDPVWMLQDGEKGQSKSDEVSLYFLLSFSLFIHTAILFNPLSLWLNVLKHIKCFSIVTVSERLSPKSPQMIITSPYLGFLRLW